MWLACVTSCANFQVVTDALVKPPKPGEPSYELYAKARSAVLNSLSRKAKMVHKRMNQIPGVCCNEVQGAMYAFPRIDIPEEAMEHAQVSLRVTFRELYVKVTIFCEY